MELILLVLTLTFEDVSCTRKVEKLAKRKDDPRMEATPTTKLIRSALMAFRVLVGTRGRGWL